MAAADPRRAILVTGATGYLGHRLVRALIARGDRVLALVRPDSDRSKLPPTVEPILCPQGFAAEAIVARTAPRAIVHAAAPPPSADLATILDAAVTLPSALAAGAEAAPVTPLTVELGSWWEWDAAGLAIPANRYAAAKTAGRAMLTAAAGSGHLHLRSLILHDVYGPQDWRGKLLDRMIAAARDGTRLPATPGYQILDWVHVDDVIAAILTALDEPISDTSAPISAWAIGHERLSLRAVAALVAEKIGPLAIDWGAIDYPAFQRMAPNVPLAALPNWRPRRRLADTLQGLAEGAKTGDPITDEGARR